MKKLLPCLTLLLAILCACETVAVDPLLEDGSVIASINHNGGDINWYEIFDYDARGRLLSVENQRGLRQIKDFHYAGDRLLETRTSEPDESSLIFRDSIAYDANGRLTAVHRFSINYGQNVPLRSIDYFTYDDQGQVIEIRTENLRSTDYNPRKVYHWQNGNIIKADVYWNGTDISLEFYYTYDNKRALNSQGEINIQFSGIKTRNNVTSVDWTDHTGLYDTACKPCNTSYGYDERNRPVTLSTNWGYSATIEYKDLTSVNE